MKRPTIGLALSGASGRAIAHAGVLDVFEEHGIPIDYIAACSSGTIIAAAYASGTLRELKRELFGGFNKKELFDLVEPADTTGGLFSLRKAGERLSFYTKGQRFEDVKPQLAFVAVDIVTAKQVAISMGDIVKGIIASCSVPFVFEPVRWGNQVLIDGGLMNITPADVVRDMGADIVISVDIAASKYVLSDTEVKLLTTLKMLLLSLGFPYRFTKKILHFIRTKLKIGDFLQVYTQSDLITEADKTQNMLQVITKVLEIRQRGPTGTVPFEQLSDIVLTPKVKGFGRTEFGVLRKSYVEGRKAAHAAIPQILKLMEQKQLAQEQPEQLNQTLITQEVK